VLDTLEIQCSVIEVRYRFRVLSQGRKENEGRGDMELRS
jgi:hypothetical protein